MIKKRDISKNCKYLLDEWKENLNLTNYERTKFEDILTALDFQINKLEKKQMQISVYGRVGVGKSSLLNALIEQQIFPTDIINGNTKINKSYEWDSRFTSLSKVELIDSPGINEVNNFYNEQKNFNRALDLSLIHI